jgi:hypothetical protein
MRLAMEVQHESFSDSIPEPEPVELGPFDPSYASFLADGRRNRFASVVPAWAGCESLMASGCCLVATTEWGIAYSGRSWRRAPGSPKTKNTSISGLGKRFFSESIVPAHDYG